MLMGEKSSGSQKGVAILRDRVVRMTQPNGQFSWYSHERWLPEETIFLIHKVTSDENLPGQCPHGEGEGKKGKEENLFKSGRKNPLGISDLLRVQLDVSNERPVVYARAIAVWEKLCSNRSSDVVGRVDRWGMR